MTSFVRFFTFFAVLLHMWMGCGVCCATEGHLDSYEAEHCHCQRAESHCEENTGHSHGEKVPCTCNHCCDCNFIGPGSLIGTILIDIDMSISCTDVISLQDSSALATLRTIPDGFREDVFLPPHHVPLPLYAQLQIYLL